MSRWSFKVESEFFHTLLSSSFCIIHIICCIWWMWRCTTTVNYGYIPSVISLEKQKIDRPSVVAEERPQLAEKTTVKIQNSVQTSDWHSGRESFHSFATDNLWFITKTCYLLVLRFKIFWNSIKHLGPEINRCVNKGRIIAVVSSRAGILACHIEKNYC